MPQKLVACRLLGMTTALLSVFGIYRATIASSAPVISVFQTVYSQCILIIVSLFYYGVAKICHLLLYPGRHRVIVRPTVDLPSSSEFNPDAPTRRTVLGPPIVMNHAVPRLTISNVWILVYGLGFVFFITGYCFLGLHPICLAFTGLSIAVLSVDELICPRSKLARGYIIMRLVTLLLTLIALVLVSADLLDSMVIKYVTTLDLYSICFGLVFPFVSQFILVIVRDNRRYTLGTVIEVCEFGFPFAVFLAIFHLCVAYGQRFQSGDDALSAYKVVNSTSLDMQLWYHYNDRLFNTVVETNSPFLIFYSITPFFMVPALICYMACVLDGCALDPLISLTFSLCVEHLATRPTDGGSSSLGIGGIVLSSFAVILRVLSEYRVKLAHLPYTTQAESMQLTHNIVWSRAALSCDSDTDDVPLSVITP